MNIGIGFPAKSYSQIGEYVDAAVKYPFESFICYGDLGDLPPYLALGMFSCQLADSAINLVGPLGSPVGRMDVELLGSHALLFEQALGSKALAGLVRGAFLDRIGEKPASLTSMSNAIDQVQKQTINTKLAVGGFGPKILTLAADKGVEYIKLGGSANSRLARYVVDMAYKSFHTDSPKIILGAVTVVDDNRAVARAIARREVAKYLAIVGRLDPTIDSDQRDSLMQFQRSHINQEIGCEDKISDSLLDAFAYSGTPDDIYERAVGLFDHPYIDHIQFGTPHNLTSISKGMAVLGEIAQAIRKKSHEV